MSGRGKSWETRGRRGTSGSEEKGPMRQLSVLPTLANRSGGDTFSSSSMKIAWEFFEHKCKIAAT